MFHCESLPRRSESSSFLSAGLCLASRKCLRVSRRVSLLQVRIVFVLRCRPRSSKRVSSWERSLLVSSSFFFTASVVLACFNRLCVSPRLSFVCFTYFITATFFLSGWNRLRVSQRVSSLLLCLRSSRRLVFIQNAIVCLSVTNPVISLRGISSRNAS